MNVLVKKMLRTIWNTRGQFLAVTAVVTVGITVYMSMTTSYFNLNASKDRFYRENNFADYYFHVVRAPQQVIKQVESLLRQLSSRDSQMAVTSPADGTILSLPAQLGQWVNPGSLLASVAATHQMEVKADILSDDLAEISEGQRVIITAPVLGQKTLVGQVKQIYPKAEEKLSALGVIQRRVPVIISLDDPGNLRPGFEVRVAVETKTRQSVPVVPREAVRTTADGRKEVMVVSGERVIHRTISTGISDRYLVEITGGLEDGEEIIRDGSLDLKEKAKVKR